MKDDKKNMLAKDEGIVTLEIQEFNTQIHALEWHMKSKYKLMSVLN